MKSSKPRGEGRWQASTSRAALAAWFAREPGRTLFRVESEALEQPLSDVFGYYLLQVGGPAVFAELLSHSRARWCFRVADDAVPPGGGVRAEPESLPIATDSIDAVLLPHALDFSHAPHALLREVERILVPEGHLLILGFNPWSLWGLWRLARRHRGQPPWNGAFVSQRRLGDWLSLLGFDIVATRRLLHRAPFALPGFAKRGDLRLLPGGVYLLHARKRVSRLVPVGLSLRASEHLFGAGVVEPSP